MSKGPDPLTTWQIVQGSLLTLLTGIGAWIAFGQYHNAAVKLQLDLYDRRRKVFDGVNVLLGHMMRDGDLTLEEVFAFNDAVAEADFLFGSDITEFLGEFRRRAGKLMSANKLSRLEGHPSQEKALDDIQAHLDWVTEQYSQITEAFRPYLRLDVHALRPLYRRR